MLSGRAEAVAGRLRSDPVELYGLLGLALVAGLLAVSAVLRPADALLLVVGAGVVAVLLLRTDFAILAVVATAPLEGIWETGPAGISLTKVAGALCLASFALTVARQNRVIGFERGQAIVLGILALALFSTLQAYESTAAVTTATRYASFAIIYVIVTQFGGDRVLQRRIAWTLAVSCSISAAIGIYEYRSGNQTLATLPNGNQNDFAFILATSLPLMFVLLRGSRRLLQALVLGAICLSSAAIMLSFSRGALVGIAAGFIVFVLTDRRRLKVVVTAVTLGVIAAVLVIQSNPERFHQALFLKQQVAQENETTRLQAWGAAARLATDHPLLGVGPGNFQFFYNKETGWPVGTLTLTVAHNALLDVAAELGIAAMCLLALYLVLSFTRLTAELRLGYGDPAFVQALRISLTIAVVSAMFLSEQYFLPFWLIGGLTGAIWIDGQRRARESTQATPEPG